MPNSGIKVQLRDVAMAAVDQRPAIRQTDQLAGSASSNAFIAYEGR
ncbi:MAG: hypothetical protein ACR2NN_29475 [Bryobacteraceae bacterium]